MGLSSQGHFHFSYHIGNFIDKNWDKFFPGEARRKRKNLLGTISGVLSQHSPETFTSGTGVIGSIGWWKLSNKWTPKEYEEHQRKGTKRKVEDKKEEVKMKRMKLMIEDGIMLDNSFLDTEDDLLNDLNQLEEEISISCGVKVEPLDSKVLHESVKHLEPTGCNSESDKEIPEKILETAKSKEEEELYKKLSTIIETEDDHKKIIPSWIREYHKKLSIKRKKIHENKTFLDRYFMQSCSQHYVSLLAGRATHDLFQSPYSNQILHPFIYRDKTIFPCWLKLMCEVKHAVNGGTPDRSTIDFLYAKPQHISAVNSLLQTTFWPGIDMSESLSYPEFTVVAMYKKLVIGCAFLVPDVCHNEAYISFLAVKVGWDRCGIGSFMLYHLTQTSHGKDIKLHVSASNPAICLYQKFGFKIEELVLDFYEKFLPVDSPHSPHALLLRLTR